MWRRLVCLANVNGAARSSASLYFGLPMFALAIDAMFKLFSPDPEFLATVFQPSKVRMLCSDAKVKVTQQRHRLELSWSFAARVEFPRTNSLLHCSQQMSKRATDHSGDLTWLVNYAFQTGIMSQPRCLFCGAPCLSCPYPTHHLPLKLLVLLILTRIHESHFMPTGFARSQPVPAAASGGTALLLSPVSPANVFLLRGVVFTWLLPMLFTFTSSPMMCPVPQPRNVTVPVQANTAGTPFRAVMCTSYIATVPTVMCLL